MPLASLVRPPARHHPVAGFRSPSFRPPCIHEAHFRHRAASVSGFLRPSATVAAWHPGPAAPVRRKASVRLAFARLHPRPGNGGDAAEHLPLPRQPAAARHRSRLSLSASDTALPNQAGLVLTNIFAMSIGVNRPSLRHAGSRLFFYLPRLLPVEQPPPPSAGTGRCWGAPHPNKFLPIHWPIRQ